MSCCKSGNVNLHAFRTVGIDLADKFAVEVIDEHLFHSFTGDIENCRGRVREELEVGHHHVLFDTVVVLDVEGEVDDRVAACKCVVLDVVFVGATVRRGDNEAAVGVLVLAHCGVVHENVVGRVDGEMEYIDGVATVGGDKAIVVSAFRVEDEASPFVRGVLAGLSVSFRDECRQYGEDEVDGAVTTDTVVKILMEVEGAGLCGESVETVEGVVAAFADGVSEGDYIAIVNSECKFEDIQTAEGVLDSIEVMSRSREVESAPRVRQVAVTNGVGGQDVLRRVDSEVQRESAVTTVDGSNGVKVAASGRQYLSVPEIRQVVIADGSALSGVVRRVDEESQTVDAVAMGRFGLQVNLAEACFVEGEISPNVRQLIAADGDGVVEEVGRVDDDHHLFNDAATGSLIVHSIAVNTCFRERHAVPSFGFSVAEHDRIIHHNLRLVDSKVQHEDAVTTVEGRQRVVVNAALGVFTASPEVRKRVVANLSSLRKAVLLSLDEGEGDDAVAEAFTIKGDRIDTCSVEGLSAVAEREVVGADVLGLSSLRGGDNVQSDGDETVTEVDGAEMHIVGASGHKGGVTVEDRQFLLTDGQLVVSMVSFVDDEGEVGDGETTVKVSFGDVEGAGMVEGFSHENNG